MSATSSFEQALAEEDRQQTRAGATEDHRAAVQAFVDKTPPTFSGR